MSSLRKLNLEEKPNAFPPLWLLVSLLVHLMVIYWALRAPLPSEPKEVEVKFIAEAPERDAHAKQIVDLPNLAPRVKPDHARYLSQYDQRVEKETQKPRENPHPWEEAVVQGSDPKKGKKPPKEVAKRDITGDELVVPKEDDSGGSKLPPRPETDYLPGVDLGEKTYLNAEAFKHTGYYLEIKRKIEIAWNPQSVLRHVLAGGISIQRGVLATYVGVTLNEDGTLADLVILRSSGVRPLDDEALRTFQVSAPFTKVPEDLLSKDGKLRFEFGFIVTG